VALFGSDPFQGVELALALILLTADQNILKLSNSRCLSGSRHYGNVQLEWRSGGEFLQTSRMKRFSGQNYWQN
jgi:hypothetical protein